MYVTDGNYRIQVLNSDLTYSAIFGKGGRHNGHPIGIACDSSGKVYVADYLNHCIQVFTAEGEFLRTFGRRGDLWWGLDRPIGIAVDTSDVVYVSEGGSDRVSVFTTDGNFVKSFGSRGVQPGQFQSARGIAVDSSGVVYVCDRSNNTNHCIQMFWM